MFQRIANLFRGFMSLFISGLEKQNPEALLEVETENLRKQIAQYNQILLGTFVVTKLTNVGLGSLTADEEHLWSAVARTVKPLRPHRKATSVAKHKAPVPVKARVHEKKAPAEPIAAAEEDKPIERKPAPTPSRFRRSLHH